MRATGVHIEREGRGLNRISSISTSGFVDEFPHVGGQLGPEIHPLAGDRMVEAKRCGVERLARKAKVPKKRAKCRGGASIDRVPQ